jgi:hypothetical protein
VWWRERQENLQLQEEFWCAWRIGGECHLNCCSFSSSFNCFSFSISFFCSLKLWIVSQVRKGFQSWWKLKVRGLDYGTKHWRNWKECAFSGNMPTFCNDWLLACLIVCTDQNTKTRELLYYRKQKSPTRKAFDLEGTKLRETHTRSWKQSSIYFI